MFDPETGFLRRICAGETEIVRAIYGAVRDAVWNTVPTKLSNVRLTTSEDCFELCFEADCRTEPIHFRWTGRIRAEAGALEFFFDGEALRSFERNRIGLCVLHPLVGFAGKPCRIQDAAGEWQDAEFPEFIAPHQPFKNVGAIASRPTRGINAEISFEGEVFETEDHRNWTDASFKTYGTPLDLPRPVWIERGSMVRQSVRLRLSSSAPRASNQTTPVAVRLLHDSAVAKPPIGLCLPADSTRLTETESHLLQRLCLAHLRVDLHFASEKWRQELQIAAESAAGIGAALHCALHLTGNAPAELQAFAAAVGTLRGVAISLILIFHREHAVTPQWLMALAQQHLDQPGVELARGTNQYFAELNRNRPEPGAIVCYSLNPQVHASDDRTIIDNLEAQPATVVSALGFGARNVAISPITLRPRFNQHAPDRKERLPGELPANVDPRQRTAIGAVWTVGSLAELAPLRGIHSLTYYEAVGWRGVIEAETGSNLPEQFPSSPGEVFPVYDVFAALAGATEVVPSEISTRGGVAAMGLKSSSGKVRVLLGNLQPRAQDIVIEAAHKISLGPYGCDVLELT